MYSREEIEETIISASDQGRKMRMLNKMVSVSGERFDIPEEDRKINIVLYRAKRANAPLVLAFHGGGYLYGGNALNDAMWSAVRDALDVNVASVEYRKSPDYRWKEALLDASDAAHYFYDHAAEYDIDPNQLSVMGCSSGATAAATVCIYEKMIDGITFQNQILMYPCLDYATDPDSKGEGNFDGPISYAFNELHCDAEDAKRPEVSPIFAAKEQLTDLGNAVLVMADKDNLKAEGYRYAEMLQTAGNPVHTMTAEGTAHAFFESGFGKMSDAEMAFLDKETRKQVRSGFIAKRSEEALQFVKECFVEE